MLKTPIVGKYYRISKGLPSVFGGTLIAKHELARIDSVSFTKGVIVCTRARGRFRFTCRITLGRLFKYTNQKQAALEWALEAL